MVNKTEKDNIDMLFGSEDYGVGVSAVVVENGMVLLIKRQDIKIWALPGGAVGKGESLEEAVKREVREETGVKIMVKCLTGVYVREKWRKNILFVFRGKKIGGKLKTSEESLVARWVCLDELPDLVDRNTKRRIEDSLTARKETVIRRQNWASIKMIWNWFKGDIKNAKRRN